MGVRLRSHVLVRDHAWRPGPGLVKQAGETLGDEAPPAAPHGQPRDVRLAGDFGVGPSRRAGEHDSRALRERLRRRRPTRRQRGRSPGFGIVPST